MLDSNEKILTTDEVLLTTLYFGLYLFLDPFDDPDSTEPIELPDG